MFELCIDTWARSQTLHFATVSLALAWFDLHHPRTRYSAELRDPSRRRVWMSTGHR